jgi:hypothetical protein
MLLVKSEWLILAGVLDRIRREVEGSLGRSCSGGDTGSVTRNSWRRLPLAAESHSYMVLKSHLSLKFLRLLLLSDHCLHQL